MNIKTIWLSQFKLLKQYLLPHSKIKHSSENHFFLSILPIVLGFLLKTNETKVFLTLWTVLEHQTIMSVE